MSLFTLKYFNIIDCLVAIIHLNVFFRLSSTSVSTRRFARHRRLPVPGRKSTCTRACMEWSLPWVECVLLFIDRTCKPSPYSMTIVEFRISRTLDALIMLQLTIDLWIFFTPDIQLTFLQLVRIPVFIIWDYQVITSLSLDIETIVTSNAALMPSVYCHMPINSSNFPVF